MSYLGKSMIHKTTWRSTTRLLFVTKISRLGDSLRHLPTHLRLPCPTAKTDQADLAREFLVKTLRLAVYAEEVSPDSIRRRRAGSIVGHNHGARLTEAFFEALEADCLAIEARDIFSAPIQVAGLRHPERALSLRVRIVHFDSSASSSGPISECAL